MKILLIVCETLLVLSKGYRPLLPLRNRTFLECPQEDLGSPLFLTPYIECGDVETGIKKARVNTTMLQGLDEDLESYSGFLKVDKENNGNMFFWFFPAEEDAEDAPVVIWLQGGPGNSGMMGLLDLHGPILSKVDENNQRIGVRRNPYSWARKHNMLYIDNPVGAGFSFSDVLPTSHEEVTDNLYEFLQQWFTLFSSYQSNPFFAFGESYGGKYVPSIIRRIHEENKSGDNVIKINVAGMGIGNGWMSPYHQIQYGDFLYEVGLLDGKQRDKCHEIEATTRNHIEERDFFEAHKSYSEQQSYIIGAMNCDNMYNMALCNRDPSYVQEFIELESSRKVLHVGNLDFSDDLTNVLNSLSNVTMDDERKDIELCLENYKTLIYNGNLDIMCHHSGILDMISDLDWSGSDKFRNADRQVYHYNETKVAGYLTKADNLHLLLVRNAGHMVPLDLPHVAQQMIEEFTSGAM